MPRWCSICGRQKHKGLCDLVELSDGTVVHSKRVEDYDGDIHEKILSGKVKVVNKWIKQSEPPLA